MCSRAMIANAAQQVQGGLIDSLVVLKLTLLPRQLLIVEVHDAVDVATSQKGIPRLGRIDFARGGIIGFGEAGANSLRAVVLLVGTRIEPILSRNLLLAVHVL